MPSEDICIFHHDEPTSSSAVCSSCHAAMKDVEVELQPDALVCAACRNRLLQVISVLSTDRHGASRQRHRPREDLQECPEPLLIPVPPSAHPSLSSPSYRPLPPYYPPIALRSEPEPPFVHAQEPCAQPLKQVSDPPETVRSPARGSTYVKYPDPLTDITRLRVRQKSHHVLHPGATFQGTQKSGRNSYDVTVTIVDVDLSSSFLCGYLRIRGLTDDWPELTTYFDAEIIGPRYGFLTQDWGATEQADMVHWARFPAFRHLKQELCKPRLTMPERDRGAVFMRWKERFLVPDHRVQDINGASFAGFYYVCVDLNPAPHHSEFDGAMDDELGPLPACSPVAVTRSRRDSSASRRTPATGLSSGPRPALMSGFYYHQNSEPYQQLTLNHIPERTSCSFEFR
ncbi:unnamed protein product [Mycena citricolor]|uniref:Vacuolar import and degradation protein-domain-containing protein n=1 Tax=Mycena citricolor TaxID=2018698 RepID=A0AAD2HJK2_9AGAR|nr:unnamed protein product [Mycena citricolor]